MTEGAVERDQREEKEEHQEVGTQVGKMDGRQCQAGLLEAHLRRWTHQESNRSPRARLTRTACPLAPQKLEVLAGVAEVRPRVPAELRTLPRCKTGLLDLTPPTRRLHPKVTMAGVAAADLAAEEVTLD